MNKDNFLLFILLIVAIIIIKKNKDTFTSGSLTSDQSIKVAKAQVIIFVRPSCPYCKMIENHVDQLLTNFGERVLKIDITLRGNDGIREYFDIKKVPTILYKSQSGSTSVLSNTFNKYIGNRTYSDIVSGTPLKNYDYNSDNYSPPPPYDNYSSQIVYKADQSKSNTIYDFPYNDNYLQTDYHYYKDCDSINGVLKNCRVISRIGYIKENHTITNGATSAGFHTLKINTVECATLYSPNRDYYFTLNDNAQLCIYSKLNRPDRDYKIYNTGGDNADDVKTIKYLFIQGDGNLIIYRKNAAVSISHGTHLDFVHWAAGTNGKAVNGDVLSLYMRDDGMLALYNLGQVPSGKTVNDLIKYNYKNIPTAKLLWSL